jgi:hypothetical protein
MSHHAHTLRLAVHSRLRDRPPATLALAGLFAGAAASLTIGVLFPMSNRAPIGLGVVLLCLAVLFARDGRPPARRGGFGLAGGAARRRRARPPGGDEFVLLMPGTSIDEAYPVIDRLRSSHPVQWLVGVAGWIAGEPLERCLARADEQLYAAKSARRAALPAAA